MASERILNEYDGTRIANAVDTLANNLTGYSGTTITPTDAMKAKNPSQQTGDRIADAVEDLATNFLGTDIIDNLTSTATDSALSANQGKVLGDEVDAIVNVYGSKNLNVYPYKDTTKTANGITFTDNGDGTVKVGSSNAQTASADTWFHLIDYGEFSLKKGTYLISGCPAGGNADTYCLSTSLPTLVDTGNGGVLTLANDAYFAWAIRIKSGTTIPAGGITFKPMIRDARIIDETYEPYAKTNYELTQDVGELSNDFKIRPLTSIISSSNKYTILSDVTYRYSGYTNDGSTAFARIAVHCDTPSSSWESIFTKMPNVTKQLSYTWNTVAFSEGDGSMIHVLVQDKKLYLKGGNAGQDYYITLIYPLNT